MGGSGSDESVPQGRLPNSVTQGGFGQYRVVKLAKLSAYSHQAVLVTVLFRITGLKIPCILPTECMCFVNSIKTGWWHYSGNQIEKNDMGGAYSTYGGKERCIQDFGWETEGRPPLGRPRRRWVDNIKMDLQEVGWAWTGLSWLRIETGGGLL
jgi:hypothetical protein